MLGASRHVQVQWLRFSPARSRKLRVPALRGEYRSQISRLPGGAGRSTGRSCRHGNTGASRKTPTKHQCNDQEARAPASDKCCQHPPRRNHRVTPFWEAIPVRRRHVGRGVNTKRRLRPGNCTSYTSKQCAKSSSRCVVRDRGKFRVAPAAGGRILPCV
jgi:hypothetical protein